MNSYKKNIVILIVGFLLILFIVYKLGNAIIGNNHILSNTLPTTLNFEKDDSSLFGKNIDSVIEIEKFQSKNTNKFALFKYNNYTILIHKFNYLNIKI